jgi:hypothetical protein
LADLEGLLVSFFLSSASEHFYSVHPYFDEHSGTAEKLFEGYEDKNYQILIFEPDTSYLGRKVSSGVGLTSSTRLTSILSKLILDLSNFVDQILVRRVVFTKNPKIYKKFKVSSGAVEVFLLERKKTEKGFIVVNQKVDTLPTHYDQTSTVYNEGQSIIAIVRLLWFEA